MSEKAARRVMVKTLGALLKVFRNTYEGVPI